MNELRGRILAVQNNRHVSLVDVAIGDDIFTAITLETPQNSPNLTIGEPVDLLFKETEVALAKNLSGLISLRNRFMVEVADIVRGELLSKVVLNYRGYRLNSVITTRAVDRLQISMGDKIEALVKANEMMVRAVGNDL